MGPIHLLPPGGFIVDIRPNATLAEAEAILAQVEFLTFILKPLVALKLRLYLLLAAGE